MEGIQWVELFTAMDHFLLTIAQQHGILIYVTLFSIFFAETGLVFMAFLPGDSLLFVAGAVASSGAMNLWVLMATVTAGAVLGNTVNYYIGRWLGNRIYDGSFRWIDKVALDRTHAFYEKHGGKTLVVARFVPVVRSFAPLVAGAARMDFHKFQISNIAGALIWVVLLIGGGAMFGQMPLIRDNLTVILLGGILAALGPIAIAAVLRFTRGMSRNGVSNTSTPPR